MRILWNAVRAGVVALVFGSSGIDGFAGAGTVGLQISGNTVLLKVAGDKADDWWLQSSTNLTTWMPLPNFGTLLSGNETNAPWRSAGTKAGGPMYYRALQTVGLYDSALFRAISITYTQTSAIVFLTRDTPDPGGCANIYLPAIWLDNGATNKDIGARFKGNTSYPGGWVRKSVNLEFDHINTNADLMTYSTVNLNNSAGDETVMRQPLFFGVMSQYTPCPKGVMCQLWRMASANLMCICMNDAGGQTLGG